jgi:hypothetical protein
MKSLGGRFLRGILGAAVAGMIGWIAGRLTVGMILTRQFDAGQQQQQIERVLPYVYAIAGFITGTGFDVRWLKSPLLRPVCWGAILGLTSLLISTRLPIWLHPELKYQRLTFFGTPTRFDIETIGLFSAPGALLAGGLLGWYFHYHFASHNPSSDDADAANGDCETTANANRPS